MWGQHLRMCVCQHSTCENLRQEKVVLETLPVEYESNASTSVVLRRLLKTPLPLLVQSVTRSCGASLHELLCHHHPSHHETLPASDYQR